MSATTFGWVSPWHMHEGRKLAPPRPIMLGVLGAFTIPGPWREACKGIFHVKGLAYTSVRSANANASDLQIGMDGSQSELMEWTAQSSAPVVVWNDERPRSLWNDQLYLAERLAPEPALIPTVPEPRGEHMKIYDCRVAAQPAPRTHVRSR